MGTRHLPASGERFWAAAAYAEEFFMGNAAVQKALRKLVRVLEEAGIPYAIAGAMALNEYGYERVTKDIDVLLTRSGLVELKRHVLGLGYVEKFPGSKALRDTEHNVGIDVLITGDFPGDGKPKPIAFPDPAEVAVRGKEGGAFVSLPRLIELKLASGMTAPHRLHDLADILRLIHFANLPRELVDQLHPYVREKFDELWTAAQTVDPIE